MDDPVWVPTVFSKNRDRLLEGDIAAAFMDAVLDPSRVKAVLSGEHFSVDSMDVVSIGITASSVRW